MVSLSTYDLQDVSDANIKVYRMVMPPFQFFIYLSARSMTLYSSLQRCICRTLLDLPDFRGDKEVEVSE